MPSPWYVAMATHTVLSLFVCGIGYSLFRAVNCPGTPRTRWRGCWVLGGAVVGCQFAAGWLFIDGLTWGGAAPRPDELLGTAMMGMTVGLLLGNITSLLTAHRFPDREVRGSNDDID